MRIVRKALTTTESALDISGNAMPSQTEEWPMGRQGKVLLRASGNDVRVATSSGQISLGDYFTIEAGQSIVLDEQLNSIRDDGLFWFASATGTANLEIWTTS